MDNATMQRMREHIKANESVKDQPYKDNKGKLTVGAGFLVDDQGSFVQQPFEIRDTKTGQIRPASETEKKAEFQRLKGAKGEVNTSLTLPQSAIDRKLDDEISTRVDKIKKEVGEADWEKLNDGQKAAVLDVHYANGSLEKFPGLKKEIKSGDANGIAREAGFNSGEKPDGTKVRNWEREARNQAAILGASQEEGRRAVIEKYRGTGENPNFGNAPVAPPKPQPQGGNDSGQSGQNPQPSPEPPPAPKPEPTPAPTPEPPQPPTTTPPEQKPQPTPSRNQRSLSRPPIPAPLRWWRWRVRPSPILASRRC